MALIADQTRLLMALMALGAFDITHVRVMRIDVKIIRFGGKHLVATVAG